jgi:acyl-CoA synthetase (AMP-forming)/AMP-acid ligase II
MTGLQVRDILVVSVATTYQSIDIDDFTLRSTLLDVQAMYWMPLPGRSEEALQRNLLRAYRTSESLIRLATDLERTAGFLTHAPHYVFRSLALATCTVILFLRTPFPNPNLITAREGDLLVHDAMTALRACSVQEDDLCIRAPNLMEAYWSVKDRLPPWDIGQLRTATFTHRLGVSIVYDCLGRWKRDIQSTRAAASNQVSAGVASEPASSKFLHTQQLLVALVILTHEPIR